MPKTRKNRGGNNFEQTIVLKFLEIMNTVKLYHWKTFMYATHKATDEFHQKIEDNIDTFVETMLGKGSVSNQGNTLTSRVNLTKVKSLSLKDFSSVKDFKREITDFSKWLTSLNNTSLFKDPTSSDLITIRYEI